MRGEPRHLPLDRIRAELFDNEANAARIRKGYQIQESIIGPELERRVLSILAQAQQDPISATWSNDEVLQQAVKAIGSNSRSWTSFRSTADDLKRELLYVLKSDRA
jgi:hypothetical protein